MSPRASTKGRGGGSSMEGVKVRRATRADAAAIVDQIVRLKRLNNEFDPLFGVVQDARERAGRYIASSLVSGRTLLMVAVIGGKVVGSLRAEIRERLFYEPSKEGHITEMYVLPEHRRSRLGEELLEKSMKEMTKMGAEIVTADLPSRNEIGVHFYSKRGFRRFVETFAFEPQ